jgi:predicted dehydrogenase
MLKVGIIGTGFGGKVQLPGLNKIKGVKVAGICGRNLPKVKELAAKNQVSLVFKKWQNLVSSNKIDIVSIATPHHLHKPIALQCIKFNKPFILEKSAGLNLEEAKTIAAAAKKKKIPTAVDFEFRYSAHFLQFKELLAKRKIGKIRYIKIDWVTGGRARSKSKVNWSTRSKTGGGVLLNYGSHIFDYINFFFGEIKSITGNLLTLKKTASISADDTVRAFFNLKNGATGNILITNVCFGGSGHTITAYGEKGTLQLKNPNVFEAVNDFDIWYSDQNSVKPTKIPLTKKYKKLTFSFPDGRQAPFVRLAEDFFKGLKKKQSNTPSIKDAVEAHRAMGALRKSNKYNKRITL